MSRIFSRSVRCGGGHVLSCRNSVKRVPPLSLLTLVATRFLLRLVHLLGRSARDRHAEVVVVVVIGIIVVIPGFQARVVYWFIRVEHSTKVTDGTRKGGRIQ